MAVNKTGIDGLEKALTNLYNNQNHIPKRPNPSSKTDQDADGSSDVSDETVSQNQRELEEEERVREESIRRQEEIEKQMQQRLENLRSEFAPLKPIVEDPTSSNINRENKRIEEIQREAIRIAAKVKADHEAEHKWMEQAESKINSRYYDEYSEDDLVALVKEQEKDIKGFLSFYKAFREGKGHDHGHESESDKVSTADRKGSLESELDDDYVQLLGEDYETKKKSSASNQSTEDDSLTLSDVEFEDLTNNIDSIDDDIVSKSGREFIKGWLKLLTKDAAIDESVLDSTILSEALSGWNESIERDAGRGIADLAPLTAIGIDLTALPALRHEEENGRVTIMRRCLRDLADRQKIMKKAFGDYLKLYENHPNGRKMAIEALKNDLLQHYRVKTVKLAKINTDNQQGELETINLERDHLIPNGDKVTKETRHAKPTRIEALMKSTWSFIKKTPSGIGNYVKKLVKPIINIKLKPIYNNLIKPVFDRLIKPVFDRLIKPIIPNWLKNVKAEEGTELSEREPLIESNSSLGLDELDESEAKSKVIVERASMSAPLPNTEIVVSTITNANILLTNNNTQNQDSSTIGEDGSNLSEIKEIPNPPSIPISYKVEHAKSLLTLKLAMQMKDRLQTMNNIYAGCAVVSGVTAVVGLTCMTIPAVGAAISGNMATAELTTGAATAIASAVTGIEGLPPLDYSAEYLADSSKEVNRNMALRFQTCRNTREKELISQGPMAYMASTDIHSGIPEGVDPLALPNDHARQSLSGPNDNEDIFLPSLSPDLENVAASLSRVSVSNNGKGSSTRPIPTGQEITAAPAHDGTRQSQKGSRSNPRV